MLSRKPLKRVAFKRKPRKKRAWHDKSMLDACRDQPCYLRVYGDSCDVESVVPCHANWADYGKGAGRKADDKYTVPGCWRCHAFLDQGKATKEEKRAIWEAAYKRWSAYRDAE